MFLGLILGRKPWFDPFRPHLSPPNIYIVGKLWILAFIWLWAIEILSILQAVRILLTSWDRIMHSYLHSVLTYHSDNEGENKGKMLAGCLSYSLNNSRQHLLCVNNINVNSFLVKKESRSIGAVHITLLKFYTICDKMRNCGKTCKMRTHVIVL